MFLGALAGGAIRHAEPQQLCVIMCHHACAGPIFMFPGALAEGPFSLRQGERCCALSLSAELGPGGELVAHSACASTVVPTLRMTYDDVDAAVSSGDPDALTPELRALLEVGLVLFVWSVQRLCICCSLSLLFCPVQSLTPYCCCRNLCSLPCMSCVSLACFTSSAKRTALGAQPLH